MIYLLEVVLILVPLAILVVRNRVRRYNKFGRVALYFCFLVLVTELFSGWLMAIHIINIPFPEPSIFVGAEFWNMLTGPAVLTIYVYIIFELIPEEHSTRKYRE